MSTQAVPSAEDSYETDYHLYEPHKAGLPKQGTYWRELWQRREFASEMSKASMRGANSMTFFGQAWLVINPLLLALVYYFIVNVLSSGRNTSGWSYFSHLTGGLFVFYYFQGAVNTGANSVVSAGKLVLNTAFRGCSCRCRRCARASTGSCRRWWCTSSSTSWPATRGT